MGEGQLAFGQNKNCNQLGQLAIEVENKDTDDKLKTLNMKIIIDIADAKGGSSIQIDLRFITLICNTLYKTEWFSICTSWKPYKVVFLP
jgi:hypothetical protein